MTADDVFDPITGEVHRARPARRSTKTGPRSIEDAGIERVKIRSVLTCESPSAASAPSATAGTSPPASMVDIGEAVGSSPPSRIGEPGTQLTLRTFHIGGTAGRIAEETAASGRRCTG